MGGASAYGSTAAAPVITEVVAAPAITTMAAPVIMAAAPMMTEVIAAPMTTTMAAPVTTEVVGSSAGGWGGAGLTTSVSGGFGAGMGGAGPMVAPWQHHWQQHTVRCPQPLEALVRAAIAATISWMTLTSAGSADNPVIE